MYIEYANGMHERNRVVGSSGSRSMDKEHGN